MNYLTTKKVFYGEYENLRRLGQMLALQKGMCSKIEKGILYVSDENYKEALMLGSIWELDGWFDAYDNPRPNDYVKVMCAWLPKIETWYDEWTIDTCPDNYKDYFKELKYFLEGRDIKLMYEKKTHTLEVLFKGNPFEQTVLLGKCKKYNEITDYTPFIDISYLSVEDFRKGDGEIKDRESKRIKSYFDRSLFYRTLTSPEEFETITQGENRYYLDSHSYSVDELHYKNSNFKNLQERVFGSFSVSEEKEYIYSLNDENEPTYIEDGYCKISDDGQFASAINIVDATKVEVISNIRTSKKIDGIDYEENSVRDILVSPDDEKIVLREHFVILPSKTKIIHYIEGHNMFEIYDISETFKIEDGLGGIEPTVISNADAPFSKDVSIDQLEQLVEKKYKNRPSLFLKPIQVEE